MSSAIALTARQRFWLRHLRACARRGQPLSQYAAEHGLTIGALYEAKSRLKRMGALTTSVTAADFVPVAQISPSPPPLVLCRIRLVNGVTVETAGAELAAVLATAARLP
ncbi:MAG: hypothetical protein AB7Q97_22860 [Gammaproteobacteria bacterium]